MSWGDGRVLPDIERVLVFKTKLSKCISFPTRLELTPDNPLYYTRYGYAALLGVTLFGGLLLNGYNPILSTQIIVQEKVTILTMSSIGFLTQESTFWVISSVQELLSKFLMQPSPPLLSGQPKSAIMCMFVIS